MNQTSSDKLANIVIGAAVVGVAFYVIKNRSLRRVAWRLAVTALTGTLPSWLGQEVQHAWADSGRRIN